MRLMLTVLSLNVLHALLQGRKSYPAQIGDLKERKSDQSWTLVIGPRSQQIIHRSIKFVAFALVPVFWHFR